MPNCNTANKKGGETLLPEIGDLSPAEKLNAQLREFDVHICIRSYTVIYNKIGSP